MGRNQAYIAVFSLAEEVADEFYSLPPKERTKARLIIEMTHAMNNLVNDFVEGKE